MKLGGYDIARPVALAPMAGITDRAFRAICRECGADYAVTEMISTRGLVYGDRKSGELMEIGDCDHPVGIQLFGGEPAHFLAAVERAVQAGADVIDINMGCPTPKIVRNGDGCALMRDAARAAAILRACADASPVPVSVKFRKGWDDGSVNAVEFAKMAEQCGVAFITVHGRTCRQLYAPPSDWDIIARVKAAVSIPVIGNGDVTGAQAAAELVGRTGCDGVMIGRAALGNPWVFREARAALMGLAPPPPPGLGERLGTALSHLRLVVAHKGEKRGMLEARKHLAWYMKGLKRASELKKQACAVTTLKQAELLLEKAFEWNGGK